jgi:OmpA-OmpF porin, OOP family
MKKLFALFIFVQCANPYTMAQVENVGTAVNSEYNELNPVIAPDGRTLYFGRKNHPQNKFGVEGSEQYAGSQDIWYSENINGAWSTARRMSDVLNRDQYNTILSITPDGNTILLKGSYVNGQYETRGFSLSQRTANGWSIPKKLEIPRYERMSAGLNEYGFLSADGRTLLMAFSTKKKSNIDDLWASFMDEDGNWSEPMNLGDDVNSDFSETTPFLAPDGKTLYFSSDREGGLGSNDIYVCKRLDESWINWSKPTNMGDAVNTDGYDAYYNVSAQGDFAYFIGSKNSYGKKDIVRLRLASLATPTTPTVASNTKPSDKPDGNNSDKTTKKDDKNTPQPETTDIRSEPVALLSGKVADPKTGKVPAGVQVVYEDLNTGKRLGVATPDPISGKYKIVLPYGKKYGITVIGPGILGTSQNIDLSNNLGNKFLEITDRDLTAVPLVVDAPVTLNNIFFEFGKAILTPESSPELNRIAKLLAQNPTFVIEISGHTDNVGSDDVNNRLSQERADAVKNYLLSKNIKTERIVSKGYGKTKPIATNDTQEGQGRNRRVDFKIIKK